MGLYIRVQIDQWYLTKLIQTKRIPDDVIGEGRGPTWCCQLIGGRRCATRDTRWTGRQWLWLPMATRSTARRWQQHRKYPPVSRHQASADHSTQLNSLDIQTLAPLAGHRQTARAPLSPWQPTTLTPLRVACAAVGARRWMSDIWRNTYNQLIRNQ